MLTCLTLSFSDACFLTLGLRFNVRQLYPYWFGGWGMGDGHAAKPRNPLNIPGQPEHSSPDWNALVS